MTRPTDRQAVAPKETRVPSASEEPEVGAFRDPWSPDGRALIPRREVPNREAEQAPEPQHVLVTGFAVPFGSLVFFGVKLVLAAVPALLLLIVIVAGLFAIAGTLLGGAIVSMATSALAQALSWIGWPW